MWSNGTGSHPCMLLRLCTMRPLYAQTTTVRFICKFCSERVGAPRNGWRAGKICEPPKFLSQNGDVGHLGSRIARFPFVRVWFEKLEVETSNLHNSTLDLTRPPSQGPSLGEGCLKLLWPQFLVLFVFYNNFKVPIPNSCTNPPAHLD